jgi:hypothetical protein
MISPCERIRPARSCRFRFPLSGSRSPHLAHPANPAPPGTPTISA